MLDYDYLFMAYERALRTEVLSRLDGSDTVLPPEPGTRPEATRCVRLFAWALYNDEKRRVCPIPRSIHLSDSYQSDTRKSDFEPKIDQLLSAIRRGDPAVNAPENEYLSRTVEYMFRFRHGRVVIGRHGLPEIYTDKLLYDWGIHHFHVEEGRGNHLLFMMLRGDQAYVLKIGTHGEQFEDRELLGIAQRNWPGLLRTIPGVVVEREFTPSEIRALRQANVAFAVNVDGQAIPSVDLRATDGTPIVVTQRRDIVAAKLRILAGWLADPDHQIHGALQDTIGGHPDRAELDLGPQVPLAQCVRLGRGESGPWLVVPMLS